MLGKGLHWCGTFSADTGNEECSKQEAADLVSNLQDFGVIKEMDQVLLLLNFIERR